MDFASLAAQYFDVSARIALALSLLASGTAFLVMHLYTRVVMRESQQSAAPSWTEWPARHSTRTSLPDRGPLEIGVEVPHAREARDPRSRTFKHARQAFRRGAYAYALAGAIHAATATALLFFFGFYVPPLTGSTLTLLACYAGVFWGWFFTTVVALALFRGPDRRFRALLFIIYAGVLPALGALLSVAGAPRVLLKDIPMLDPELAALMISFAGSVTGEALDSEPLGFSPGLQPLFFLTLTAAPFAIPVLGFNRFVRGTVGPLFITFPLLMALSVILMMNLFALALPVWGLGAALRALFGEHTSRVLVFVSFLAAVAIACLALLWVVWRYRRRKLSDQMLLFDALWLSVSICICIYLMGYPTKFLYLLGLLPFVLYKLVLSFELQHFVVSRETLPNARLLFLRVFGSARRSEQLLDLLLARWRYAGSVQLLSAADSARSSFEPDEFLDFVSGRFAKRYINNRADLEERLADIDLRPDADGRHRVNELFCRADIWQQTVTRLMVSSDLVVMDLRGFTAARQGCVFELGALIDRLPLERVVLLIDATTDMPLLRETLESAWDSMATSSPNGSAAFGGSVRVRVIDLRFGYTRAVQRLLDIGDQVMLTTS